MITLAIIKALAIECRRDLALLTGSLLSSVNTSLAAISSDLEVAARAGSVVRVAPIRSFTYSLTRSQFTAWTTYTDGHLIEVDQNVRQDYMSCLQVFSLMGRVESKDEEVMNRLDRRCLLRHVTDICCSTRLVGLAALTGVVTSEALYNSTTQLKAQISTIMPALMVPLLEVEVSILDTEYVLCNINAQFLLCLTKCT